MFLKFTVHHGMGWQTSWPGLLGTLFRVNPLSWLGQFLTPKSKSPPRVDSYAVSTVAVEGWGFT